jgi:hypothetical protein
VRNFFVPTKGRVGQTAQNELNNLAELLASLRPSADGGDLAAEELVRVQNGYTMSDEISLTTLNGRIAARSSTDRSATASLNTIPRGNSITLPTCWRRWKVVRRS